MITPTGASRNSASSLQHALPISDTGSTNVYGACAATNASGVSTCTLASTKAEVKTLSIATPVVKSGGTVTFTPGAAATLTSVVQRTNTTAGARITVTVRSDERRVGSENPARWATTHISEK